MATHKVLVDLDVDGEIKGTTLDINGAGDVAGDLVVSAGKVSITGDGSNNCTLTESGNGNLEIKAPGTISLDANGANIALKDGGTQFGLIQNSSTDFIISTSVADKDLILMSDDGAGDASAYITLDGSRVETQVSTPLTVGVDDAGKDVTFYGDTSGKKMLWDTSDDTLVVDGILDVNGNVDISGTITMASDQKQSYGNAATFIEGMTSGSKLGLYGQTDILFRINSSTVGSFDANKLEMSAYLDITNTTDSTDATGDTGALRCEGGASIAKKLYAGSTITGSADVIAYSDEKLKENVKTLDGKKVLEMRGVSFDRIDTGKASSGVIAQEMEKVAPELVIDDGNYKGVAYGNIVGYLIEAIKDQQKQINELKEIINGCSK